MRSRNYVVGVLLLLVWERKKGEKRSEIEKMRNIEEEFLFYFLYNYVFKNQIKKIL